MTTECDGDLLKKKETGKAITCKLFHPNRRFVVVLKGTVLYAHSHAWQKCGIASSHLLGRL